MEDDMLPRITDVPSKKRHEFLMRKLRLCSVVFDLSVLVAYRRSNKSLTEFKQSGGPYEKLTKTMIRAGDKNDTLEELMDYVPTLESLPEDAVSEIKNMVRANIFRAFPSHTAHVPEKEKETDNKLYGPGDKRPLVEGAWVHLLYVYEFLQRIVDAGLLRDDHIEESFVENLFNITMNADDSREACFVANLLPSFWEKFPQKRPVIWTTVRRNLSRFVSSRHRHIPSAVTDLLRFASERIRELPLPLKDGNKLFIQQILIPLHKTHAYPDYSLSLNVSMLDFLNKDRELANMMFEGILSGDPIPPTSELCLLDELKSLMNSAWLEKITKSNAQLLFRRIAKGLTGSDVDVAKIALDILSWDRFIEFAKLHKNISLPVITPALQNAGKHCVGDESVQVLAAEVRNRFYNVERYADRQVEGTSSDNKRRRI
ncbi:hypothetical protein SLE2022_172120 [Rubroshorea leprosula]